MVGNIGRQKGTIKHCLITAYLVYPIRYYVYDETVWLSLTLSLSALAFDTWSKQFDKSPPTRGSLKLRTLRLTAGIIIYLSIFCAFLYFNGKISDGDGGEIPVHEAIQHLFTSPWWTDLKQSLHDTWVYAQHHGWYEIYNQILESIDVDGERNAFLVSTRFFFDFLFHSFLFGVILNLHIWRRSLAGFELIADRVTIGNNERLASTVQG